MADFQEEVSSKAATNRPLALRLEDWIDDHFFGFAKQEGWFNAIAYYAIRDPRYQRAEVCWSQCVEGWKKAKPLRYPPSRKRNRWRTTAIQPHILSLNLHLAQALSTG